MLAVHACPRWDQGSTLLWIPRGSPEDQAIRFRRARAPTLLSEHSQLHRSVSCTQAQPPLPVHEIVHAGAATASGARDRARGGSSQSGMQAVTVISTSRSGEFSMTSTVVRAGLFAGK